MTVADGFCTPHTAAFAREIADARAEMATWDPDRRASVQLQGTVRWSDKNTAAAAVPSPYTVGSIQFGAAPSSQRPVYSEGRKVIVTDDLVERITRAAWEVVIEACGGDQSPNVWAFDTLAKVVRRELER